jgi:TolA-binding protein
MGHEKIAFGIFVLVMTACGGTGRDLPSVETTPIASRAELENLEKRKKEDKKALEDEQAITDKRLEELNVKIQELTKELNASQETNLAERAKIQKELDDARREKQAAEDRLNQLKDNQKRLEEEATKAKTSGTQQTSNGTVSSTSSSGSTGSTGGIVTTTGSTNTAPANPTNSTSGGSTTPSMNPSVIPLVGTAYSCVTSVGSTDGTTRLQATFNGGTVPYVIHWIDMTGKLIQTSTVNAGASQLINTTLGHAFQLMSLDGKSCYGRVKVGNSQNTFTVR